MTTVQVLCACPAGARRALVRRLEATVGALGVPVEVLSVATLSRRTRFDAFVSASQPTIAVLRDGVLVSQAVGEIAERELRSMMARELRRS
jgi:hypothetical protein